MTGDEDRVAWFLLLEVRCWLALADSAVDEIPELLVPLQELTGRIDLYEPATPFVDADLEDRQVPLCEVHVVERPYPGHFIFARKTVGWRLGGSQGEDLLVELLQQRCVGNPALLAGTLLRVNGE